MFVVVVSAAGGGAGSGVTVVEGSASALEEVAGSGGMTVRSLVLDGSVATFWFGTAVGLATRPIPPDASAYAPEAEEAAGGSLGLLVAEGGASVMASSSQSISSSAGAVEVLGTEFFFSLSFWTRRAMRSAFLPV